MSIQKDILKIYGSIFEQKNLLEVFVKPSESVYPNITFSDRSENDEINKALLDDIQTAASAAGVKVNVGYAKTGHGKMTKSGNVSRHYKNSAVDINIVGGKVVNPENKEIVNRFVDKLIAMGYTKNSEGPSHPKAVLTYGFPAHDDHVHVSNMTDDSSDEPPSNSGGAQSGNKETKNDSEDLTSVFGKMVKGVTGSPTKTFTDTTSDDFGTVLAQITNPKNTMAYDFIKGLGGAIGLKEEKIYGEFGNDTFDRGGIIKIPKEKNVKIKSAVDGVINNSRGYEQCTDRIVIEHDIDGRKYYLMYCGIKNPVVRDGQYVKKGSILGTTDNDVDVSLYDMKWDREYISTHQYKEKDSFSPIGGFEISKKKTKQAEPEKKKKGFKAQGDLANLMLAPFNLFKNKRNEEGEITQKRWARVGEKEQPEPWIAQMSPTYNKEKQGKKLKENIERIKKLLK